LLLPQALVTGALAQGASGQAIKSAYTPFDSKTCPHKKGSA